MNPRKLSTVLLSAAAGVLGAACVGGSIYADFTESDSGEGDSGLGADGSSLDAASSPDAPVCVATTVAAKRAPANVLFVVDRSGSMNCNPPPTTTSAQCEQFPVAANPVQPTKWSITRNALKSAVAAMPTTNGVGIAYFNVDDDCGVVATPSVALAPIEPPQLQLVNTSLDAVAPKGFSPVVGGVTLGYQYLHAQALVGRKSLVLLTDSEETCAVGQQAAFVDTTVKNASLVGIRTFVIGAPGSEGARAFLSQVAYGGQTARTPSCIHEPTPADVGDCHFDLTTSGLDLATELSTALGTISREAVSCDFELPDADGGAVDYGRVNVLYVSSGGQTQTIPQDRSTACDNGANGWQYDQNKTRILLCGSSCAAARSDAGGNVSIALGCQTQVATK